MEFNALTTFLYHYLIRFNVHCLYMYFLLSDLL